MISNFWCATLVILMLNLHAVLRPTVAKLQSYYLPPEAVWSHTSQDYLLFILHQSQPSLSLSMGKWMHRRSWNLALDSKMCSVSYRCVRLYYILFWKVAILTILLKGLEIKSSCVSEWVSCSEVGLWFCISLLWVFIWFPCQFHGQTMREVTQEPSETGAFCFPGELMLFGECWDVKSLSSLHLRGR